MCVLKESTSFFKWRTLVPSARPLFSFLCVCTCPTKSVCCIFQLWKIQSTEFGLCWRKNGQLNLLVHCLPFWDMSEIWKIREHRFSEFWFKNKCDNFGFILWIHSLCFISNTVNEGLVSHFSKFHSRCLALLSRCLFSSKK